MRRPEVNPETAKKIEAALKRAAEFKAQLARLRIFDPKRLHEPMTI